MKIPPINMKRFYAIGKWAFFVMAIMNLAGWIDSLKYAMGFEIIKGIASVIFSFALFGFFSWMNGKQASAKELNNDELKALSELVDSSELKTNKKEKDKK